MPSNPDDSSTHSAWGSPVLHPRSSDPCHDDAKGKASRCDKPEGWRWNLDFVVSPTGFVQRYDYTTESNKPRCGEQVVVLPIHEIPLRNIPAGAGMFPRRPAR